MENFIDNCMFQKLLIELYVLGMVLWSLCDESATGTVEQYLIAGTYADLYVSRQSWM